jgi:hypothetical protein
VGSRLLPVSWVGPRLPGVPVLGLGEMTSPLRPGDGLFEVSVTAKEIKRASYVDLLELVVREEGGRGPADRRDREAISELRKVLAARSRNK